MVGHFEVLLNDVLLKPEKKIADIRLLTENERHPKSPLLRHNGAINHIFAKIESLELHDNFCFLQNAQASSKNHAS
jgi:hypothetical protein